jgi:FkbM family methyltransferase
MNIKHLGRRAIWCATRRKGLLAKAALKIATAYVDAFNDFSYEFEVNGEKELLHRLTAVSPKTVFDVGANVGEWTQMALQAFPLSRVHSFEISKRNFARLNANVRSDRCEPNNVGLADLESTACYKDYGDGAGGNTLLHESTFHDSAHEFELIETQLLTGDAYCLSHDIEQIDLLKLDVEGVEHLVLHGFDKMFTKQAIRCVQFEYGYSHADAKFLMKDFYRFFEGHGYSLGKLWHDGVAFTGFEYALNDFKSGPNFVAVPSCDTSLMTILSRHGR